MEIDPTTAGEQVIATLASQGLTLRDFGLSLSDLEEMGLIGPRPGPVTAAEFLNLLVDEIT